MEYARKLLQLKTDERILRLRESAKRGRDPSTEDETLNFLLLLVRSIAPARILEIGTAEGLSGAAMLSAAPQAKLTTVELDEERYRTAARNFRELGLSERVDAICADAGEALPCLRAEYDLIFLDGPKAQYLRYLPHLKRLLRRGGILFADDVLLYGWVDGREPVPDKRRSIVEKIRAYLAAVTSDPDLTTSILDLGEGVAVSVKN